MTVNEISRGQAIVIGSSAGGVSALLELCGGIGPGMNLPLFITQHTGAEQDNILAEILGKRAKVPVVQAEDKMEIENGVIYLAPANYHMLVESRNCIALSMDEKVNYSRPSIDVLFESAARVYSSELTGIILTGASIDGAAGIVAIEENGGLTIAQDPATAEFPFMPESAIKTGKVKLILPLEGILEQINSLSGRGYH